METSKVFLKKTLGINTLIKNFMCGYTYLFFFFGLIIVLLSNEQLKGGKMAKDHGKQIKDDKKYEALRKEGASKEKAARIANTPNSGKKGGKASKLEERTKKELLENAKKIGIKNRHQMKKAELINAIRNH